MTKRRHIKDSERFSIVQEDYEPVRRESTCFICRRLLRRGEGATHEIFFGNANRQKSKDYGLVVRLCDNHHDRSSPISVHSNPKGTLNRELQLAGRKAFEKHYPNEDFLKIFGRNYGTEDDI